MKYLSGLLAAYEGNPLVTGVPSQATSNAELFFAFGLGNLPVVWGTMTPMWRHCYETVINLRGLFMKSE